MNNVVLASGVQQSDSTTPAHVSVFFFQILFPFRLLHDIEQSFLCYAVGPGWLSILNTAMCTVQFSRSVVSGSLRHQEPQHARPPCQSPTPGVHPNPCPSSR